VKRAHSREATPAIVITCEHATNRIPRNFRACFADLRDALASHQGYDRGALRMAKDLADRLHAPLFQGCVSRLLVYLNRSPEHPRLHEECVRRLPVDTRRTICASYYAPMRRAVEQAIAEAIASGRRVLHVSSHSFTPVFDGEVRNADVGLLYDPDRKGEASLCENWRAALLAREPRLHVGRNYPYAGKSDGFAAYLRHSHPAADYLGIELEINQRVVLKGGRAWSRLRTQLVESLAEILNGSRGGRDARRP
jgi:predicted N-formylglutamate amidohydrolase